MRKIVLFTLALCLLPLVAIQGADDKPKLAAPTLAATKEAQEQGRYLVTMKMENGKIIEIVLEGQYMPYTVANFVQLVKAKFYDGVSFHRVETDPEFKLIQGGDPEGTGRGTPGYRINLEISPFLSHKKGAISMASTAAPNSAGCQFFIALGDVTQLDTKYAVFGWVKKGQDVADAVKKGDKMKTVTVAPYDGKEECPLFYDNVKP